MVDDPAGLNVLVNTGIFQGLKVMDKIHYTFKKE